MVKGWEPRPESEFPLHNSSCMTLGKSLNLFQSFSPLSVKMRTVIPALQCCCENSTIQSSVIKCLVHCRLYNPSNEMVGAIFIESKDREAN